MKQIITGLDNKSIQVLEDKMNRLLKAFAKKEGLVFSNVELKWNEVQGVEVRSICNLDDGTGRDPRYVADMIKGGEKYGLSVDHIGTVITISDVSYDVRGLRLGKSVKDHKVIIRNVSSGKDHTVAPSVVAGRIREAYQAGQQGE